MIQLPAQINVKSILKDAERSVNRRTERAVENKIDDVLDNAEDKVRGKNKKNDRGEAYENNGETKVIKEVLPFNFSGNLTISIEGTGGVDNNLIKVVSNKYDLAIRPMLVKKPHNLIIYNKQDEAATKINTELYDDKALKEFHDYEIFEKSKTKTEFERTSDIKEIDGFIARKYVVDGDDYEGVVWLSAEVDLDYDLFASLMEYQRLDLGTSYGFPLEMHITYKSGDTMDFFVKNVEDGNPDKALFDVKSYDLIDMTDLKSGN
jgi:hypothetical protein